MSIRLSSVPDDCLLFAKERRVTNRFQIVVVLHEETRIHFRAALLFFGPFVDESAQGGELNTHTDIVVVIGYLRAGRTAVNVPFHQQIANLVNIFPI